MMFFISILALVGIYLTGFDHVFPRVSYIGTIFIGVALGMCFSILI